MFLKRQFVFFCAVFIILILSGITLKGADLPTKLSGAGYSVIPTPRHVELSGEEISFIGDWKVQGKDLAGDHIALQTLTVDMKQLYGLEIYRNQATDQVITLSVDEDAVQTGANAKINRQGYLLEITPSRIKITGNGEQGLFYGVQTLIQLIKPASGGRLLLPECIIKDWPCGQMRILHWDTKHHQDRIKTLKRYLDWSARFKVNMIGFELEDKFAYPSHPVIGAPGAFTTEELQEIVNYGQERYIQVVPVIQSPAHMNYVLKHPEFKNMRANCDRCPPEGLNYQVCLCKEQSYELIFDMYRDVIEATRGVDYFHVSTDELYYAGVCDRCKQPYNEKNRSSTWAEYASRAHDFLSKHDRRMLAWVEYPLLAEDISGLPSDIIDAVQRGNEFIEAEQDIGMEGLVYVSMQGSEDLIPRNFNTGTENSGESRLHSAYTNISFPRGNKGPDEVSAWKSDHPPLGVFGAAWDDAGLHNETFWLGWSTVAQYGWTPEIPSVDQHVTEFMKTYYGPKVKGMADIYRGLQKQADFFERSWEWVEEPNLKPVYGWWKSLYKNPQPRLRRALPQPALYRLPRAGLNALKLEYRDKRNDLVEEAKKIDLQNRLLREKLYENYSRATRNHYNLEVLLSLADFTHHHNRLLITLKKIEDHMVIARESDSPEKTMDVLIAAYHLAEKISKDRKQMFSKFKDVWEVSRFPKGRSVGGKTFFHELDDIKTHWAYQEPDLSFYTAAEERIDLKGWREKLSLIIKEYGENHGLSVKNFE